VELLSYQALVVTLAAAVSAGTPLLFAALGETLTERSGILNLGVGGMMIMGAVAGYMVAFHSGSPWLGVLVAMVAGGTLALLHAFVSITLRASQIVSGLALTILGLGLSSFLGKPLIGRPLPAKFDTVPIPLLADLPVVGPALFRQDSLVYLSYVLVIAAWVFLYRTKPGLHLLAVGENPAAADAMGANVFGIRYVYTVLGGMLAGLGGAYLSLAYSPVWIEEMTAGRGWIALALVIFSMWNPARVLLGAYLFGAVEALVFRIQALGSSASPFFLYMLPYLFTIAVLLATSGRVLRQRLGGPAALGVPYHRESR